MPQRLHEALAFNLPAGHSSELFKMRKVTFHSKSNPTRVYGVGGSFEIDVALRPNEFLLPIESKFCYTLKYDLQYGDGLSSDDTFDSDNPQSYGAVRWGPVTPFSSITESIDAGTKHISSVNNELALRHLWCGRCLCANKPGLLQQNYVLAGQTNGTFVQQRRLLEGSVVGQPRDSFSIQGAETWGCDIRANRQLCTNNSLTQSEDVLDYAGFCYTMPMSAVSTLCSGDSYVPLGLLSNTGQGGLRVAFTIGNTILTMVDQSQETSTSSNMQIIDPRFECSIVQVNDQAYMDQIMRMFNQEASIDLGGERLALKLQHHFLNYQVYTHQLGIGQTELDLFFQTSRPDVRGFLMRFWKNDDPYYLNDYPLFIKNASVKFGNELIPISPATDAEHGAVNTQTMPSFWHKMYEESKHLFSLEPQRDRNTSQNPMAQFNTSSSRNVVSPHFIAWSFENVDYSQGHDEDWATRGLDCRNVGSFSVILSGVELQNEPDGTGVPQGPNTNTPIYIQTMVVYSDVLEISRSGSELVTDRVVQ